MANGGAVTELPPIDRDLSCHQERGVNYIKEFLKQMNS